MACREFPGIITGKKIGSACYSALFSVARELGRQRKKVSKPGGRIFRDPLPPDNPKPAAATGIVRKINESRSRKTEVKVP